MTSASETKRGGRSTSPFTIGGARIAWFAIAVLSLGLGLAGAACSSCAKKAGGAAEEGGRTTPGTAIPTPPAHGGYVTNNASDTLSVIDREGDLVTNVAIDLDPAAHEAPHHLSIDPVSKTVFVALAFPPAEGKKGAHASHGNASEVGKLARLDLGTLGVRETRDVDENPGDVVLTHDRRRVLVTHFDMKRAMDVAARGGGSPATMFAHIAIFDAKHMTKIGSRPVCVAPHGMAITRDDTTAYVACYGSDELAIVDLAGDGFPTSRLPLGATQGVPGVPRYGPYSATLSPDETHVIVGDLEGQDIRVLDRETKRFVPEKTVHLAAKAFMPAFVDSRTLLVPMQAPDGLARIDMARSAIERRRSFDRAECSLPHVVRVARDGRAYLVCEGDHRGPGTVLEIDPVTLDVKKKWIVGAYPDGLAFGDE